MFCVDLQALDLLFFMLLQPFKRGNESCPVVPEENEDEEWAASLCSYRILHGD